MSASEPAFLIGVVSESINDQQIARGLAERVLVERIDWLETEMADSLCGWQGVEKGTPFLSWAGVEALAKRRGRRIHGKNAGAFDERRARLALFLFNSLERRPDAVVFVRDTDNVAGRVPSLERAREYSWAFPVVQATPHTKRECWILNGYEADDADEQAALRKVCQDLGFDPCLEAERLTAMGKKGKRNAKTVLEKGLGVELGSERETACWRDTDLDTLREKGDKTLLVAYLKEVAERLAPILTRSAPEAGLEPGANAP